MLTIPITIVSMVYMILLTIVFFSKERIDTIENKIYANMIKLSLFGIILDTISCLFVVYGNELSPYFKFITLLIFIYYILWSGLFLLYVFTISLNKKNDDKEFIKIYSKKIKIIVIFFIVCAFLVPFLPLTYIINMGSVYPKGLSVDFTYFIAGFVSLASMLILMVINRKNIKSKKYVPVYALIFLLIVMTLIQKINPNIIITTSIECFITFLMYFTVENPDVQMIRELYKNKQIIEKSNEDQSKFLFRITADIKKPIEEIKNKSKEMIQSKTKEELIQSAKYINSYSSQLDILINKALNISSMDSDKIKLYNTRYNVKNLFKEIELKTKEELNTNTEFNLTITNNMPTYLYGDAIKLKQIVSSLLNYSVKYTKEGFINLNIAALVKYDICRLNIEIEDSGCGMDIDKVNEILSLDEDVQANNEDMNIKSIKKMIQSLGGSFLVKSEIDKGTNYIIVIDQKIVNIGNNDIEKKLEDYESNITNEKKYLVIDNNEKELETIKKIIGEEINVTTSMFAKDAYGKYSAIILNDDMNGISALNLLQELKQNKNFKTPVIVMLEDSKEAIKLHYLQDGFADCIMKSKLESEIKRIAKLY